MRIKNPIALAFILAACLAALLAASVPATLPSQLTDEAFWKLVTDYSEPGGTFLSDNFVSNERSFQDVLPELVKGRQGAGGYIGVGPEQNFTYVAALKPPIAFVIDIRRQNMVEHLIYKALFELSTDRADFLSRLFSRPRPAGLSKDSSVAALFHAFEEQAPDSSLFVRNMQAVRQQLIETHKFKLTGEDLRDLEKILDAFLVGGPNLTYNGPRIGTPVVPPGLFIMPTIAEMMTETTRDGPSRTFLASEEDFRIVQEMQKKNLIVPLVGDFAGATAIRATGSFLKEHGATVSVFYTSNVEQYLFMSDDSWPRFYKNVATLPIDSRSAIVRGLIRDEFGTYSASPRIGARATYEVRTFSIADLVAKSNSDGIRTYLDVVGRPPVVP